MNSYVTLVANADYVIGAVALARSLKMVNSRYPLTVLAVGDIEGLDALEALDCIIKTVEPLPFSDAFKARHARESVHKNAPFTKGTKPTFHQPLLNFVKLRLWELTEHDKIVFLDSDLLVVKNIDRLFDYPEFVAAPNVYESMLDFHRMNSGVFVAQPNIETFNDMLITLDQPGAFWKRTDQTFLQSYFPDWNGLPYIYNVLQYVWFNLPELWHWQHVHVVHYQYEKPWQKDHPKRELLAPLIDLWWHVYEQGTLPEHLPEPRATGEINP